MEGKGSIQIVLAQTVLQLMARAGSGAFLISGATVNLCGGEKFSAFTSAKFALRGFTRSRARVSESLFTHIQAKM